MDDAWMAGGGVRGGWSHGNTDDYGYEAVDGKVHIHDWHATILHLLGLDHTRLTYRYAGRNMRLTDVKGGSGKGDSRLTSTETLLVFVGGDFQR
jgi:hypothetical protein